MKSIVSGSREAGVAIGMCIALLLTSASRRAESDHSDLGADRCRSCRRDSPRHRDRPAGKLFAVAGSTTGAGLTYGGVSLPLGTDAVVLASGVLDGTGQAVVMVTPPFRGTMLDRYYLIGVWSTNTSFLPLTPSAGLVLRNGDLLGGVIGTPGPVGPVGPEGPWVRSGRQASKERPARRARRGLRDLRVRTVPTVRWDHRARLGRSGQKVLGVHRGRRVRTAPMVRLARWGRRGPSARPVRTGPRGHRVRSGLRGRRARRDPLARTARTGR